MIVLEDFTGQGDCTEDEVWAFMQGVVKFCETTDWITMYSPYGMLLAPRLLILSQL
jgi:hypothetical protein